MRLSVILLLFATATAFSQTMEQRDSIISVMCKELMAAQDQSDSSRIEKVLYAHLYPVALRVAEEDRESFLSGVYYRFQRNCPEFIAALNRLKPPKGDWKVVSEKPVSILKKRECVQFLKHQNFYYLEASGDTVKLEIKDGYWVDHFKDGSFSKLKFHWVNDCEFDIEFIESNNSTRENFSKPGERYRYQILSKEKNFYNMSVQILDAEQWGTFKVYY